MKFGIYVPNFGQTFGSAKNLADLTKIAEDYNWDGFFIWDHMLLKMPDPPKMVDPWVALTAMAFNTKKIKIGTTVTPIARRSPWKLARETVSIDHLSEGRLILGIGLGEPADIEFGSFNYVTSIKERKEKTEESLEVLLGLWSGQDFSYKGKYFNLVEMKFLPKPFQKPRIPIWIGGQYPRKGPIARAAKYDGMLPLPVGFTGGISLTDFKNLHSSLVKLRNGSELEHKEFELVAIRKVMSGSSDKTKKFVEDYKNAGVTWLLNFFGASVKFNKVVERLKLGPPNL